MTTQFKLTKEARIALMRAQQAAKSTQAVKIVDIKAALAACLKA